MKKLFLTLLVVAFAFQSCNISQKKKSNDIRTKVDLEVKKLKLNTDKFAPVVSIDHARLAEEVGVYTPPSIVSIFSNTEVNSSLLQLNQLIGLDLPYKILCYSEPDTLKPSIAYTSASFIQKRHGLSDADITDYSNDIKFVLQSLPEKNISPTNVELVDKHFGIISFQSDFDFNSTIEKLKKSILSQGDTKWFGEIDFQKEAESVNIKIDKTTLLLFGGPAPGGLAMVDSPKLGLDAFCQKLLVFENNKKQVIVAFNDIPAFSILYYDRSTKPQEIINGRLKSVFEKALSNHN